MVGRAEQNEIAIVPRVATLVLAGREGMVVLDQTVAPAGMEELVPQWSRKSRRRFCRWRRRRRG
jgi:hypothetical protein